MQDWKDIRPIVEEVLKEPQYTNSARYNGEPCFLTAYQIAVLVDERDSTLKGALPIGGKGVGPESFAQRIARHLSDDVNKNVFGGKLEIRFLSISGLDKFTFGGGNEPSSDEFSMFRLIS